RRRHTRSKRDWSSDVCSSDLCGNHRCISKRKSDFGRFIWRNTMQPGDAVCTGKGAAPGSRRRNESADACKFRDCQRRKKRKGIRSEERREGKEGRARRTRRQG